MPMEKWYQHQLIQPDQYSHLTQQFLVFNKRLLTHLKSS